MKRPQKGLFFIDKQWWKSETCDCKRHLWVIRESEDEFDIRKKINKKEYQMGNKKNIQKEKQNMKDLTID